MNDITKEVKKDILEGIISELDKTDLYIDNVLDLSSAYQRVSSIHNNADVEENLLINEVCLKLLTAFKNKHPEQVGFLSKAYQRILTVHQNNIYQGDK